MKAFKLFTALALISVPQLYSDANTKDYQGYNDWRSGNIQGFMTTSSARQNDNHLMRFEDSLAVGSGGAGGASSMGSSGAGGAGSMGSGGISGAGSMSSGGAGGPGSMGSPGIGNSSHMDAGTGYNAPGMSHSSSFSTDNKAKDTGNSSAIGTPSTANPSGRGTGYNASSTIHSGSHVKKPLNTPTTPGMQNNLNSPDLYNAR